MRNNFIAAILAVFFAVTNCFADEPFQITTQRLDNRIEVKSENDKAVLVVRSPFGISNATIERTTEQRPDKVVIQLRLKQDSPKSFKAEWIDFYRN